MLQGLVAKIIIVKSLFIIVDLIVIITIIYSNRFYEGSICKDFAIVMSIKNCSVESNAFISEVVMIK